MSRPFVCCCVCMCVCAIVRPAGVWVRARARPGLDGRRDAGLPGLKGEGGRRGDSPAPARPLAGLKDARGGGEAAGGRFCPEGPSPSLGWGIPPF